MLQISECSQSVTLDVQVFEVEPPTGPSKIGTFLLFLVLFLSWVATHLPLVLSALSGGLRDAAPT